MGRKSLKDVRSAQILDAFEECILEYGLEKSSFQRIAARAGVQRTLITHYFGTREALVEEVVARILARYAAAGERALAEVPEAEQLEAAVDLLFDLETSPRENTLYQALFWAAETDAKIRRLLNQATEGWIDGYRELLTARFPEASPERIDSTASGLVALSYGGWTLLAVDASPSVMKTLRRAAGDLLAGLAS